MNDLELQTSFRMAALVPAYLGNSISEAGRKELEQWLAASESNREALQSLLDEEQWQQLAYYRRGTEAARSKVFAQIAQRQARTRRMFYFRAAAVGLVLIAALSFIWMSQTRKPELAKKSTQVADILPGSPKAKLVLSNGESLVLDEHADTTFMQGSAVKVQQQQGLLAYQDFNTGTDEIQYHQLITPNGGEYHLQLEDGTHVWLNAASSIRFPTRFTGAERRVQISGEAYFEVAKDARHPFFVDVDGKASIEVLGTHFNVKAYQDDESMHTTLLEGSVAVTAAGERRRIVPGQRAVVHRNAMTVEAGDTIRAVAWKNGEFDFNDARLTEVMRQVSRWYDVEIIYEKGVPDIKIWGRMKRNQNLQQLIGILNGMDVNVRLEEGRKLVVLHHEK